MSLLKLRLVDYPYVNFDHRLIASDNNGQNGNRMKLENVTTIVFSRKYLVVKSFEFTPLWREHC